MSNWFKRKVSAMDEPEITGTEAIRARVLARKKRAHLSRTAEDLGLSLQALESFASGADNMPIAALEKLTAEFFFCARYDAASDRLIDTNTSATSMGIVPEPWQHSDPEVRRTYAAYLAALKAAKGEAPVRTKPIGAADPGPLKRPGFA